MNRGWDKETRRRGPREEHNSREKNKPLKHLFKHIWNGTKGQFHARAIIFCSYCLVQLAVWVNDKNTWNSVTCACVCNFRVHCRTTGVPEGYTMLQKSRESFPITELSPGAFFKASCQRSHPGETGQDPSRKEVRGCCSNGIHPLCRLHDCRVSAMLQDIICFIQRVKFSACLPCCLVLKAYVAKIRGVLGEKNRPNSFDWEVCN